MKGQLLQLVLSCCRRHSCKGPTIAASPLCDVLQTGRRARQCDGSSSSRAVMMLVLEQQRLPLAGHLCPVPQLPMCCAAWQPPRLLVVVPLGEAAAAGHHQQHQATGAGSAPACVHLLAASYRQGAGTGTEWGPLWERCCLWHSMEVLVEVLVMRVVRARDEG